MLGCGEDEIGSTLEEWSQRVHPDDLPPAMAAVQAHLDGRVPTYLHEHRMRCKDGRWIWILDRGLVVSREADGKPRRLIGAHQDITERKEAEAALRETNRELSAAIAKRASAEAALRESQGFYHALVHQLPAGVFRKDAAGRYVFVSPWFCQLKHMQAEEFLGRTALEVVDAQAAQPDPTGQAVKYAAYGDDHHRQIMATGQPVELVEEYQTAEGRALFVNVLKSPVIGPDGTITGTQGIVFDITARKRAEEELANARTTLEAAFEQTPVAMVLVGLPDGVLRIANTASRKLLGILDEPTPVGLRLADFVPTYQDIDAHGDPVSLGDAPLAQALLGQKTFGLERKIVTKTGEVHWVVASGNPIYNDQGALIAAYLILVEITERKLAESALRESLAEKESLLREVHHRVKSNLQVITSLLRLESGRATQPGIKSVLGDIQGRIRSMALLHESLYRSGTFAAVDLGGYLKQIATQTFRSLVTAPSAVLLQLDLASASATVEMDQAMPCGLLVNELVTNCLKHGFPAGHAGEVRVELHRVDGGPSLCLRVSDTGIGLPADFEEKRGLSLGLQLVADLARQIGGRLETGPDTTFTITFVPQQNAPIPPIPT
jgi:PAS domain S-box-containing protein